MKTLPTEKETAVSDTNTPEEDFPSQIPTNVVVQDVASTPTTQQPQRRQRSTEERTGHFLSTPAQQEALAELYNVAQQTPPRAVNQMSRAQASREMQRLLRDEKVRAQWKGQEVTLNQRNRLNDLYAQLVEHGLAEHADTSPLEDKLDAADRIDYFQQLVNSRRIAGPFSL